MFARALKSLVLAACLAASGTLLNQNSATAASVEEMAPQLREAFVRGIQEELLDHGYNPGPVDGVMGSRSRTAIRLYQRDAGLPVDGVASDDLLNHLKFVTPRTERKKARSAASPVVVQAQRELADRGYYNGAIDGLMGPKTYEAVRSFQFDANLPATGVVDDDLVRVLRQADPALRGPYS